MQTFMPYASYEESASVLDRARLGKQRVEGYQILLQLCGVRMIDYPQWAPRMGGWNHAALDMWAGHEVQLVEYIAAVCNEWTSRGYRDTCLDKSRLTLELVRQEDWTSDIPPWVGDEQLHRSHRSMLLWKDYPHYRHVFPEDIPEDPEDDSQFLDYVWRKTGWDMKERKLSNYLIACQKFEELSR